MFKDISKPLKIIWHYLFWLDFIILSIFTVIFFVGHLFNVFQYMFLALDIDPIMFMEIGFVVIVVVNFIVFPILIWKSTKQFKNIQNFISVIKLSIISLLEIIILSLVAFIWISLMLYLTYYVIDGFIH